MPKTYGTLNWARWAGCTINEWSFVAFSFLLPASSSDGDIPNMSACCSSLEILKQGIMLCQVKERRRLVWYAIKPPTNARGSRQLSLKDDVQSVLCVHLITSEVLRPWGFCVPIHGLFLLLQKILQFHSQDGMGIFSWVRLTEMVNDFFPRKHHATWIDPAFLFFRYVHGAR